MNSNVSLAYIFLIKIFSFGYGGGIYFYNDLNNKLVNNIYFVGKLFLYKIKANFGNLLYYNTATYFGYLSSY